MTVLVDGLRAFDIDVSDLVDKISKIWFLSTTEPQPFRICKILTFLETFSEVCELQATKQFRLQSWYVWATLTKVTYNVYYSLSLTPPKGTSPLWVTLYMIYGSVRLCVHSICNHEFFISASHAIDNSSVASAQPASIFLQYSGDTPVLLGRVHLYVCNTEWNFRCFFHQIAVGW